MKQDKLIFYAIGILILLAILGYILVDYSWGNFIDILQPTELP